MDDALDCSFPLGKLYKDKMFWVVIYQGGLLNRLLKSNRVNSLAQWCFRDK